ncbi:MAG: hypothetical protein Q9N26_07220 [Aquificota bacterium]|nr:hypothetical protein [Aquificota bacterium]
MERIEELGLLVDWERGKVYRDKGILSRLLSVFGTGLEEVHPDETLTRRITEDRIRWLYTRASLSGKTELSERDLRIRFEPSRIVVDSHRYRIEYTPGEARMVDKESGKEEVRTLDIRTFGEVYSEMKELLGYGDIRTYARSKAERAERREVHDPIGAGLLGLGGGLLTGLILSEMYHHIFHTDADPEEHTVQDYEDFESFDSFDDFDMV